jgi:hypothetical protein
VRLAMERPCSHQGELPHFYRLRMMRWNSLLRCVHRLHRTSFLLINLSVSNKYCSYWPGMGRQWSRSVLHFWRRCRDKLFGTARSGSDCSGTPSSRGWVPIFRWTEIGNIVFGTKLLWRIRQCRGDDFGGWKSYVFLSNTEAIFSVCKVCETKQLMDHNKGNEQHGNAKLGLYYKLLCAIFCSRTCFENEKWQKCMVFRNSVVPIKSRKLLYVWINHMYQFKTFFSITVD